MQLLGKRCSHQIVANTSCIAKKNRAMVIKKKTNTTLFLFLIVALPFEMGYDATQGSNNST